MCWRYPDDKHKYTAPTPALRHTCTRSVKLWTDTALHPDFQQGHLHRWWEPTSLLTSIMMIDPSLCFHTAIQTIHKMSLLLSIKRFYLRISQLRIESSFDFIQPFKRRPAFDSSPVHSRLVHSPPMTMLHHFEIFRSTQSTVFSVIATLCLTPSLLTLSTWQLGTLISLYNIG